MDCIVHGVPKSLSYFHFTSLPSKEQTSFNCMAAVTVCSDFGAQDIKLSCFYFFFSTFSLRPDPKS